MLNVILLNVMQLNVIQVNGIMLNGIMLNGIMLNVIALNCFTFSVVMLRVMAPHDDTAEQFKVGTQKKMQNPCVWCRHDECQGEKASAFARIAQKN
jgi:hypothetical protein